MTTTVQHIRFALRKLSILLLPLVVGLGIFMISGEGMSGCSGESGTHPGSGQFIDPCN